MSFVGILRPCYVLRLACSLSVLRLLSISAAANFLASMSINTEMNGLSVIALLPGHFIKNVLLRNWCMLMLYLFRAPRHNGMLKVSPDVVPPQVCCNKSRPPTLKTNRQSKQPQGRLETSVRFGKEPIQFPRNGSLPRLKFRKWMDKRNTTTEAGVAKKEKEAAKTETEVNTANETWFMLLQRPEALKTRKKSCHHLASSLSAERLCTSTTSLPMIQFTLTWKLCACTSRRN